MDYYTKKGKNYCAHFPTAEILADQAINKRDYAWHDESITGSQQFTGTNSINEAQNLLVNGWREGAEKLMQINANAQEQGNKIFSERYDVAGHYPSAQRYAAGMPDCMVNRGTTQGKKKVLRVCFPVGASGGISTDEINNYGSAFLSIVDTLENNGYSLEIIVASKVTNNGKNFLATVTGKEAGEPLDIERLAFMLVNPSMLRRFFFATREINPDLRWIGNLYGISETPTQKDFDGDILVFPALAQAHGKAETPKGAREFLIEQTNKLLGYDALERD